ncbi:MAG: cation diffusion facilitator family transporter [Chitinophagaceae bacterium]|nr:cation diffusion facilitator family transporter [Chitinophagaceae bacterium]
MNTALQNIVVQRWIALLSVFLLILKFLAYWITHSAAIFTDALESIVNVVAGFFGLYSLYVSAKPRDSNHPYGHGKIEFISAAIEGTLIGVAGILILYKAVRQLIFPIPLRQIDNGMILIGITSFINFFAGLYCLKTGRRNQSAALVASGHHLKTDALSTLGILAALGLYLLTRKVWLDSAVALLFGLYILYTSYRILRSSVAGIMDEADEKLLARMIELLNKNRKENWIDLHNLRVIKYGHVLHVDCHLTVPWYLNVHEAHAEIDDLAGLIRKEFGESLELFVHSDGCLPFSCKICSKENCHARRFPFEKRVEWTPQNILLNSKHSVSSSH